MTGEVCMSTRLRLSLKEFLALKAFVDGRRSGRWYGHYYSKKEVEKIIEKYNLNDDLLREIVRSDYSVF